MAPAQESPRAGGTLSLPARAHKHNDNTTIVMQCMSLLEGTWGVLSTGSPSLGGCHTEPEIEGGGSVDGLDRVAHAMRTKS
jgi:hypothetical protein